MSEQVRVLLLDPDGRTGASGRSAFPLSLHRCQDAADLLGRAAAGAAEAAVLMPGSAGLDATIVGRLRSYGCRVIAVVATGGDADLAARIGISDVLAAPLDWRVLLEHLRQGAAAEAPATVGRTGRVVAVWGPPGAPGRTSVAALLCAGAHRAGCRVILVDADLAGGSWSLLSAVPCHTSGLPVALRRAAGGGAEFDDLLVRQAEGIDLLPLAPDPQRWVEANPAAVPVLLDALAQQADGVVVDLGADIRSAHPAYDIGWAHDSAAVGRAVLGSADAVIAVLSADPIGVHRFASWWPVLISQRCDPVIVANKLGLPGAGRRPQEQVAAVLASIGADCPRVDVRWEPKAAEGLLAGDWSAARGWRSTPQSLWAGLRPA